MVRCKQGSGMEDRSGINLIELVVGEVQIGYIDRLIPRDPISFSL